MKEIFKDIEGYEDIYQVSNLGRIKSLKRKVPFKNTYRNVRERFLKQSNDRKGYKLVSLNIDGVKYTRKVHQLVMVAFTNYAPDGNNMVINHKNFKKNDNRLENLEVVTNRNNTNKKHLKSISKYTGVTWNKFGNKWMSQIMINGKLKYLGRYEVELDASIAYENALKAHLINN